MCVLACSSQFSRVINNTILSSLQSPSPSHAKWRNLKIEKRRKLLETEPNQISQCQQLRQWRLWEHQARGPELWYRSHLTLSPLLELPLLLESLFLVPLGTLFFFFFLQKIKFSLFFFLKGSQIWLQVFDFVIVGGFTLLEVVWLVLQSKLLASPPKISLGISESFNFPHFVPVISLL